MENPQHQRACAFLSFFLLCWSSCSESDMRAVVIQQSLFSSALKPTPHYPVHRIHSFWTHSNQLPIRHFPSAVSLILEQETLLTDILTISRNAAKQMFGLSFQASACSFCVISLKPFSVFNSLIPLAGMMPWAEAFFLFQLCPVFYFPLYFYTNVRLLKRTAERNQTGFPWITNNIKGSHNAESHAD